MASPITDPDIPYVGPIEGDFHEGSMVRIQGQTSSESQRFNINLQTGPETSPRDDVALHISVRLVEGYIARNTLEGGNWGTEQGKGDLPIGRGQKFEIIVLCGSEDFKIAINGRHFGEFPQRIRASKITHLTINGDVAISLISYEGGDIQSSKSASTQQSGMYGPPPTAPEGYGGQGYGPPPGQYGPPPGQYGPPQQGGYNPYGPQGGYPQHGGYGPPPPPGAPQEQDSGLGDFLGTASSVIAGAISSGMADKLIGSLTGGGGHQQPVSDNQNHNQQQQQPMQHQPQQQPHDQGGFNLGQLGQLGGGGSIGGLGSIGSLLTGFADQIMHPKNDGHH